MGLQEARDILFRHSSDMQAEQWEDYDFHRQDVIDALEFAIDKLEREIASYRNY